MKILVIGGGGREHALVWALRKSARVTEVVCAPGNPGIAELARCVPLHVASVQETLALVEAEAPGLVIIGPEIPLAAGVVDALSARGIPVFGPTRAAAQLETSKSFSKRFMRRWGIPTAAYAVSESLDQLRGALEKFGPSVVVKADGLAAGKGVILCETHDEALAAAAGLFDGTLLGSKAESVVLEEMLVGPEISFFAICDGKTAVSLAFAQDHKRIGEGDTGPNTGGMGAYSSDDLVDPHTASWLLEHVAKRVVTGMAAEGTPFSGVLFTGLMMTADGPKVLEFNTRFGDPETEAIMLRLETDLLDLCQASVTGDIGAVEIRLNPGASASVVAASAGYPGKSTVGTPITGLGHMPPGVEVFHAGTALQGAELVTAGGRVLAVSAAGNTLAEALDAAYSALSGIHFEGMQYRRDIGRRALNPNPSRSLSG